MKDNIVLVYQTPELLGKRGVQYIQATGGTSLSAAPTTIIVIAHDQWQVSVVPWEYFQVWPIITTVLDLDKRPAKH